MGKIIVDNLAYAKVVRAMGESFLLPRSPSKEGGREGNERASSSRRLPSLFSTFLFFELFSSSDRQLT